MVLISDFLCRLANIAILCQDIQSTASVQAWTIIKSIGRLAAQRALALHTTTNANLTLLFN